jgi:AcrR family transcriptional regulator
MDAGERTFVRNGFASTTIEEITQKAGVAKGTFYLYFDSKEAILESLRDRFIEGCRGRIEALASRVPAADWAGRLDAWVEGGIRHYLDHVKLHDVLFHDGLQRHGSKAQNVALRELAELIRAGDSARAWRVESPELVSVFLFYALHGIADHILSNRRSDHKAAIRLSQRIVRNAIGISAQSGSGPILSRS